MSQIFPLAIIMQQQAFIVNTIYFNKQSYDYQISLTLIIYLWKLSHTCQFVSFSSKNMYRICMLLLHKHCLSFCPANSVKIQLYVLPFYANNTFCQPEHGIVSLVYAGPTLAQHWVWLCMFSRSGSSSILFLSHPIYIKQYINISDKTLATQIELWETCNKHSSFLIQVITIIIYTNKLVKTDKSIL